jgi:hypothetical protein
MQYEAETHETPARGLPLATAGVGTIDQAVPAADATTSPVITGTARAHAIEAASIVSHRRRPALVTRGSRSWR